MGANREQRVFSRTKIIAGMLAIGLGFPALASANHQELPSSYFAVSSIQQAGERSAAIAFANDLLAFDREATSADKRRRRRFRTFRVLNYSRSLAVGKDDVIVRFRSPGKKRSIVTFELKF